MTNLMDRVRFDLANGRIAMTLRREIGDVVRVRYLSPPQAGVLGLLLTSKAPEEVINLAVGEALSLQIEPEPERRAWLSALDLKGGRTLVVALEGKVIPKAGRHLVRLSRVASQQSMRKLRRESLICPAHYCHLADPDED